MKLLTEMVLLLALVAYVAIGGVGFHFLEDTNEEEVRDSALLHIREFLDDNKCVRPRELESLLRETFDAFQSGQLTVNNTNSVQKTWDYYSSIFFAMTVITTIGYGNISPATWGGRIFCILFALIGIPLCLVVLANIGQDMNNLLERAQKRCFQEDRQGNLSKSARICGSACFIIFGILIFIVLPGIIFSAIERWSYFEGFYYSFVTLSTVGFGDYVAGQDAEYEGLRGLYRLCTASWILLGLSWMAGAISSLQAIFTRSIERSEDAMSARSSRLNSRSDINAVHSPRRDSTPRDYNRMVSSDSNKTNRSVVNGGGSELRAKTPPVAKTPPAVAKTPPAVAKTPPVAKTSPTTVPTEPKDKKKSQEMLTKL